VTCALANGGSLVLAQGPDGPGWQANGNNLYFNTGNVSIGAAINPYPLYVVGGGQAVILGTTNTPTGVSIGVWGQSSSTNGRGVYGYATAATGGAYGGLFRVLSNQGFGVYALADASTGMTAGIRGQAASTSGTGLWGLATAATGETNGVFGKALSPDGAGVYGLATSTTGVSYGVYGQTMSLTDGFGVYCVGDSATTGLKLFQIDHPLDPAHKLLNHFSEEGPEPYLVYRGTAVLDVHGFATVRLPGYFEAINRDPQYQLTPIGAPALLYIAQEIADNQFMIGGGRPGMKVCWMVTGVRNDAFVRRYGVRGEVEKRGSDSGRYLHPELHGSVPAATLRGAPVDASDAR
jgi:hypothetical protein